MSDKRITTYQYRIKDGNASHRKALRGFARSVNYTWNYCNATTQQAWKRDRKWLRKFDVNPLLSGSSKLLGLHSQTLQAISEEHADKRNTHKKCKLRWRSKKRNTKLRWRSKKRNTDWIPFKASGVKVVDDTVKYQGVTFRFWKSREWPEWARLKTGSFSQDARGRWYVNFQLEVYHLEEHEGVDEVGIDLGLKDLATCSDGEKYDRENLTKTYEDKLAMAQRANKKGLVRTIHAKIGNKRKDWAHKTTTKLVKRCSSIAVGNLNVLGLLKTKLAKSVSDAAWGFFVTILLNKAVTHGIKAQEINEAYTTQTCHVCKERTGPKGLEGLGVREWECPCGAIHDRDTNAAQNIYEKARLGVCLTEHHRSCRFLGWARLRLLRFLYAGSFGFEACEK
jgi:IS605 OrfB family transposase